MAQYRLAELARSDLAQIHRYVADDSSTAADRLLATLFETFGTIAAHPDLGPARPVYKGGNLRCFSVGNYVIFYRLADRVVEVARVIHGAREIDAMLG